MSPRLGWSWRYRAPHPPPQVLPHDEQINRNGSNTKGELVNRQP